MSTIFRWVSMYLRLQILHIQVRLEYPLDFYIGLVGATLRHVTSFLFLYVVFANFPTLQGWTSWEVYFLFGMVVIPRGLSEVLFLGHWRLRLLVNNGEFDWILLRPVPAPLLVLGYESGTYGLGSIVLGTVVILLSGSHLGMVWSADKIAFLAVAIVNGCIIDVTLVFCANCIAFWLPAATSSLPFVMSSLVEFAKFPLSLFGAFFEGFFSLIIPIGFISYYPTLLLLHKTNQTYLLFATPLTGLAMLSVAVFVWKISVKRYQSTGS